MDRVELIVSYNTKTIHRSFDRDSNRCYPYCNGKNKVHTDSVQYHGCINGTENDFRMFIPWLNASPANLGVLLCAPCKLCCSDLVSRINKEKRKLLQEIAREYKQGIREIKQQFNKEMSKQQRWLDRVNILLASQPPKKGESERE